MSAARDPLPRHLDRGRRLARLVLGWEALWPRLWPALGVIGLFLAVALSGLLLRLPALPHLLVLASFVAALAYALWRGFRGFALPGAAAADRRLEADSGLRHRPLATLADTPATQDPMALALWQVHRTRALAALKTLRVRHPRPGLPARDPRALRVAVLLLLVTALVAAGPEAPERLRRAMIPGFGAPAALPALKLEAWITPPTYTGAAPIFLDPAGGNLTVPQGSRLSVALSGGAPREGVPELLIDSAATPFRSLDAASFAIEAPLAAGSRILVRREGRELAQWGFAVQPDAPPTAAFSDAPGRATRGGLAIRLPWRAEDDWGIASVQAELRLEARPTADPLLVPLPLPPGNARQPQGVAQPELTAHPWAGLSVIIRILARDGAGQQGTSAPQVVVLPERSFNHPVARALVALRRGLSLAPGDREPAWRGLDALATKPDAFENDITTYLSMRIARQRLRRDSRLEAVAEAQELMWQAAVALEEGRADRTQRALAEAREALREALAEAERTPPDAEGRTELERRVQELREAIQQHLQALAERLQQENAEAQPGDPRQRMMDQREVERRTEAMKDAAREGRTDRMQQELAELEKMLDALQQGRMARQEGGNNRRQQQQQQREKGQQQMGVVQDMVARQGEMLDRAHQRGESEEQRSAQERRPNSQRPRPQPGQQQQDQQQPAAPGQPAAEAQRDARQQRALRRALGELMQQFGDLTGEIPEPLGRADQAMRQAQEALGQGGDPRAAQQQAIRELQEGGREMAQSMQRQFGQGQQPGEGEGEGPGEGQGNPGTAQGGPGSGPGQDRGLDQAQGRDPLGRQTQDAPGANEQGSDTQIPGEAELLRSRRIQEELRRRGGERERSPGELDYIDRLLKTF